MNRPVEFYNSYQKIKLPLNSNLQTVIDEAAKLGLTPEQIKWNSYQDGTEFFYDVKIPNKKFEEEMAKYRKWREQEIERLEKDLAKLKDAL